MRSIFAMRARRNLIGIALVVVLVAGCQMEGREPETLPFTGVLAPPYSTSGPPSGTVAPNWQTFSSLKEAQDHVSFPLLVPEASTLPPGVNFESAQLLTADHRQAIALLYPGKDIELTIQQLTLPDPMQPPTEPYEMVTVRGTTGYLVSPAKSELRVLIWEENGRMLSVSGELDKAQLLRIAESLTAY